jgi:CDP-diacylglycerol--serine O-phosphatidyltransferase
MEKRKKDRHRRGIFILPNIFTSLNIFCGFFSVILSIEGQFAGAAISILVAVLFDALDGKIARATNTTSRFGVEYDSLADLISFGMAPAMLMYLWALKPFGRLGWLAAFLFMACGALRLARFNTQVGTVSGKFFVGLPIPAGAGMNATLVLLFSQFHIDPLPYKAMILILLYILSFLMVSTIKYNSFKEAELFKKMKFNVLVMALLILIFIAAQPAVALFLIGLLYVISGPLGSIMRRYRLKTQQKTAAGLNLQDPDKQDSPPKPSEK